MKIHDHLTFEVWHRSGGDVQTTNRMTFETDLAPQMSCHPAWVWPDVSVEDPSGHFSSRALLGHLAIQFKVATAPGSRWSIIWESKNPTSQILPPSQPSCAVVPRSRWSLSLCRCRRVTHVVGTLVEPKVFRCLMLCLGEKVSWYWHHKVAE